MRTTAGGFRTGCGCRWSHCCRRGRCIRSAVITRGCQERPQGLCLDAAYDNVEVRDLCEEFAFTAHIRSRGEEKKALAREAGFRARRWVVERTHSWLNSEDLSGCLAGV